MSPVPTLLLLSPDFPMSLVNYLLHLHMCRLLNDMAPSLKPKKAPHPWANLPVHTTRVGGLPQTNPSSLCVDASASNANAPQGKPKSGKQRGAHTSKGEKKLPPARDAANEVYEEFLHSSQKKGSEPGVFPHLYPLNTVPTVNEVLALMRGILCFSDRHSPRISSREHFGRNDRLEDRRHSKRTRGEHYSGWRDRSPTPRRYHSRVSPTDKHRRASPRMQRTQNPTAPVARKEGGSLLAFECREPQHSAPDRLYSEKGEHTSAGAKTSLSKMRRRSKL